jgi:hypothetical protein
VFLTLLKKKKKKNQKINFATARKLILSEVEDATRRKKKINMNYVENEKNSKKPAIQHLKKKAKNIKELKGKRYHREKFESRRKAKKKKKRKSRNGKFEKRRDEQLFN